jgi:hypothetical protein
MAVFILPEQSLQREEISERHQISEKAQFEKYILVVSTLSWACRHS